MPGHADLSRLNAIERELLGLLAEGHTAKSIATQTGRSEGAVNERLREARRKTGIGSSRELARLLRNNGDEQIGVGEGGDPRDDAPAGDRRRLAKGSIMALSLTLAAGAAVALVTSAPDQAQPPADPLVDAAMGAPDVRPEAIRMRFLAEQRDPAWAPAAERALRARYDAVIGSATGTPLRITCRSSLCEVAGRAADGEAASMSFSEKVQGRAFVAALASDGLTSEAQAFGTPRNAPKSLAYAAYWSRVR